jgi:chromosome segregation ATPase
LRESNLLNSKLAASTSDAAHKDHEIEVLALKLEDAHLKYLESARVIEDLRDRLSRQNLRPEESRQQQQIVKTESLQEELEQMRQRVQIPALRNESDVIRLAELSRELERLKIDLQEFNATRIERDTLLQDVRILQDKVAALSSIESQNVDLRLRIEAMTTELNARNMRESRQSEQIARLLHDREQLEVVRNELLKIEEELNRRGGLERKLQCRVNFYRVQASEQRAQLDSYEGQVRSFRETIARLEKENAGLKRQVDDKHATGGTRIERQLNRERKKSVQTNAENIQLRRKLAKYRAVLDDHP